MQEEQNSKVQVAQEVEHTFEFIMHHWTQSQVYAAKIKIFNF